MLVLADAFLRLVFALKDVTAVLKASDQKCRHAGARHLGCSQRRIETTVRTEVSLAFKAAVVSRVLIGVVLLGGCSSDEEQARELMRQRQASRQGQGVSGNQGSDIELLAMKLSESVIAEKAEGSEAWYVSQRDSKSYLKLPFQPPSPDEQMEAGSSGSRFRSVEQLKQAISLKNSNPGFLGAEVCGECHQDRHRSFVHTAHHLTSGWMPASEPAWFDSKKPFGQQVEGSESVQDAPPQVAPVHGAYTRSQVVDPLGLPVLDGVSEQGEVADPSVMSSSDPAMRFQMLHGAEGFSQKVSIADYEVTLPVHVFTGSAKAGQTFLYWHGQRLYQSFVSYLTELDQWIPSPGYFDTTADYTREIGTTCLECHVTYIDRGYERGTLKPDTAVWGISCERCHGPGQQHVEYHRGSPDDRIAKFIAQPSDLPRQRQLDICSQCHSGSDSLMTGKFDFRPGMEVEKKKRRSESKSSVGGVHTANQLNRLAMSACFQQSEMTCTTCHDPHVNQRGQREVFSKSCLNCHQVGHCGMVDQVGQQATKNCIDCHMPTGDNDQMTIEVGGGDLFTVRMIDHHIRVDQSATEQFLKGIEWIRDGSGERAAD